MIVANIFDFIDGKVAHITNTVTRFGAFWDSTLDRFSDIALFLGLIYLYADLGRTGYVMVASLAMMFSIMTSYARARAESLIDKCKVGFMERPERIVLFMIGAFTDRMAAVLWVILILSIVTVHNRIHYTYPGAEQPPDSERAEPADGARLSRAFFWRDERATLPYDLWVVAILAFIWLTPPDWLRDPTAAGMGSVGLAAADIRACRDGADGRFHRDRVRFEALQAFGPMLSIKLYRLQLNPPLAGAHAALPRSRGDAARGHPAARGGLPPGRHVRRPPRAGVSFRPAAHRGRHGVDLGRALRRVARRLVAHVQQRFPRHRVTRQGARRGGAANGASPRPAGRRCRCATCCSARDVAAVKAAIDRLQTIGSLMEKESRVASWGVRTVTAPVLAGGRRRALSRCSAA